MPPDATPAGVSIPDLNDPNTHLSREAAMNAMRARRRETALNEMDPGDREALIASRDPLAAAPGAVIDEDNPNGDAVTPGAEPQQLAALDAPAGDRPAQQLDLQRAEETVLAGDALARYRVKMKVNGVERDVPLDQAVATAQKVEAADVYLEIARQRVAEADRKAADAPVTPALPTQHEKRPTGVRERVGKAFASTFQGDEATATEELTQAIEESARNIASPEVIRGAVTEALREQAIADARSNVEKKHKDLLDDPIKRGAANHYISEELRAHGVNRLEELPPTKIAEVFDNGVARTRAYFKESGATPGRPTVDLRDGRREAKRGIDEPATAGTRASAAVTQPKTTSDVINGMRQARGQPVAQ